MPSRCCCNSARFATADHEHSSMIDNRIIRTQKEITSQTDLHLISLSSKAYVFEDQMTKYYSL